MTATIWMPVHVARSWVMTATDGSGNAIVYDGLTPYSMTNIPAYPAPAGRLPVYADSAPAGYYLCDYYIGIAAGPIDPPQQGQLVGQERAWSAS